MKTKFWSLLLIPLGLTFASGSGLTACSSIEAQKDDGRENVSGVITGVHHLGPKFFISDFSVDKKNGGNVGPDGGGSSYVCCLMIPAKWHPGLTAEISWEISDWLGGGHADGSAAQSGTYRNFTATVPFEEYGDSGGIYIHFFEGGKVRIVTSIYSPNHKNHPILRQDSDGGNTATIGKPVVINKK